MKPKLKICLVIMAIGFAMGLCSFANEGDVDQHEVAALKKKAEAGDGEAAYRVYNDLTIDQGLEAEQAADHWLLLAVRLKNADAERLLAIIVENGNHAFATWGKSRTEAVENLLKSAAESKRGAGLGNGLACDDLGRKYVSGYFGAEDDAQARVYYLRGSQLGIEFCFTPLAKLYDEGKGGPKDEEAAYYWVSLDAQCVSSKSVSGEEIWTLREKISKGLSLAVLRQEWARIDTFNVSQRDKAYPPPFLFRNQYPKAEIREGENEADRKEKEYRERMEKRG